MVEITEEMVQQAMDAYNEVGMESDEHRVIIRAALAAAAPLIEAAVREECVTNSSTASEAPVYFGRISNRAATDAPKHITEGE